MISVRARVAKLGVVKEWDASPQLFFMLMYLFAVSVMTVGYVAKLFATQQV